MACRKTFEWGGGCGNKNLLNAPELQTNHDRLPTNDDRLPTSDDRLPTNDDRLPTNDDRLPTNDDRLPRSDDRRVNIYRQAIELRTVVPKVGGYDTPTPLIRHAPDSSSKLPKNLARKRLLSNMKKKNHVWIVMTNCYVKNIKKDNYQRTRRNT